MSAVAKHIQPATWYPPNRVSGDGSESRDLFTVTVVVIADVTARPMAVAICRTYSANEHRRYTFMMEGGTYASNSGEQPSGQRLALCVHEGDREQVTDDEKRIGCRHKYHNEECVAPVGNCRVDGSKDGPRGLARRVKGQH